MPQQNTRSVKRRKKRRNRRKIALAVFLLTVIAVLITLSLTVFFPIAEIGVKGDTRYSSEQIIKTSGVAIGDNLFRLNDKKIEQTLTERLPYLLTVDLKRSLPDTLVLTVKEIVPQYAFSVDGKYLLVGQNKALELVEDLPEGITQIVCEVEDYELGKPLSLGKRTEAFSKICTAMGESGLSGITQVDMTDTSKITMRYEDRLTLELGSLEDVQKKMKKAVQIIEAVDSDYNGKATGTIRLQYEDAYFEKRTVSSQTPSSQEASSEETSSLPEQGE